MEAQPAGFLPGYPYDIYISSANDVLMPVREDNPAWFSFFISEFSSRLSTALGTEISFFAQETPLEQRDPFEKSARKALMGSAFFIALISEAYLSSEYCMQELSTFCRKAQGEPVGLMVEKYSRIVGILGSGIPAEKLPREFEHAYIIPFFDDTRKGAFSFAEPDSELFRSQMDQLVSFLEYHMKIFRDQLSPTTEPDIEAPPIEQKVEDNITTAPEPLSDATSFYLTNKAISDVWTLEDLLGYETYANAIARPILDGVTKPPISIAIQAPWGQGKTSLMRMIQEKLEHPEEAAMRGEDGKVIGQATPQATFSNFFNWLDDEKKSAVQNMLQLDGSRVPTVWFNPLYYQESEQIWAGMAHAILHQLAGKLPSSLKQEEFWLRLRWKRLNKEALRKDFHTMVLERFIPRAIYYALLGILLLISLWLVKHDAVTAFGGLGASMVAGALHFFISRKFAEKWTLQDKFSEYVQEPDYEGKMGYLYLVDHDIIRALQLLTGNHPVVVFIDDLDRCRPDVVSDVILAINQFISLRNSNIIFILGIDPQMVAESLENALKQKSEPPLEAANNLKSFGWQFLEKFIQLPFFIPHIPQKTITRYLEILMGKEESGEGVLQAEKVIEEMTEKIRSIQDVEEFAGIAEAVPMEMPAPARKKIEDELSRKAGELLRDPKGEELSRLVEIAIEDQNYNPRAMKRFLNLVRLLRQIQLIRGTGKTTDNSRLLITRAAHLILNWPQILLWARSQQGAWNESGQQISPGKKLEEIATLSESFGDWCNRINTIWGAEKEILIKNPAFYQFLRRISLNPPGLVDMYREELL